MAKRSLDTLTFDLSASDILNEVMPGYRNGESIMGYCIRKRNEQRAKLARRKRIVKAATYFACLILWPLATLGIVCAATSF